MAGMRMPGMSSGIDPKMVDQLIEIQKLPIQTAKARREKIVEEKAEFDKLGGLLNDLDSAINGIKTSSDFSKMKVESSHPDIVDGVVEGFALRGSYEFEVRGLAKSEKELAYGFPDKNETPVGFGFMLVERDDKEPVEVVIEPNSTLQDVARQINDTGDGIKAMVINTKYKPNPYRLLVVSEESGKEAKITIDEDTTFLEFKEQVTGRNLDILFEDVPITDGDNTLDDLLDGVTFFAKRSEPGTRVQVNIANDIDATLEGIKEFVNKYNAVAEFVHSQMQVDPKTEKAGILAADSTTKMVLRQLQTALSGAVSPGGKYRTLADIGITTEPKGGTLNMDDTKVKAALAEDYEAVAKLFVMSRNGNGVAEKVGSKLKNFRDPGYGMVKSRQRGLERIIKNQDKAIEQKERLLEQKEEGIRRRFTALEGRLANLQSQGNFLAARFAGGGGAPGGGKK